MVLTESVQEIKYIMKMFVINAICFKSSFTECKILMMCVKIYTVFRGMLTIENTIIH